MTALSPDEAWEQSLKLKQEESKRPTVDVLEERLNAHLVRRLATTGMYYCEFAIDDFDSSSPEIVELCRRFRAKGWDVSPSGDKHCRFIVLKHPTKK